MSSDGSPPFLEIEIIGASMEPTLAKGERVRVRFGVPALGFVAAIQAGNSVIVHRLVDSFRWRGKRYFVHIGDASKVPGICAEHELLGPIEDLEPRMFGYLRRLKLRLRALRR
ncbi:MAG: S24/S26 family peptidase [Planctomycetes bacterium]|nr:S24/S26 family peptidase [Planctomycetota bacterium]